MVAHRYPEKLVPLWAQVVVDNLKRNFEATVFVESELALRFETHALNMATRLFQSKCSEGFFKRCLHKFNITNI
jgi:hypothetical protein